MRWDSIEESAWHESVSMSENNLERLLKGTIVIGKIGRRALAFFIDKKLRDQS